MGYEVLDPFDNLSGCLFYYEIIKNTFTFTGNLAIGNVPQIPIQYVYKRIPTPALTYSNVTSSNVATGNPTILAQSNQGARLALPAGNVLLGGYATYTFDVAIDAELGTS
jgi:hypothetical protein